MKGKTLKPIIFLLLVAPFTGEVLSTSTPLFALVNPLILIPLMLLYGLGALIIREFLVKWKKGLISLLLWGAAYGIIEEALILRSVFNPNWTTGDLMVYGRVWGINCVWTIGVVIYHMLFSITTPIMLSHLAFPEVAKENWLGRKTLLISIFLFSFVAAPLFYHISSYNQPIIQYTLFAVITVLLIFLGKKTHSVESSELPTLPTSTRKIFFWGATFTPLFFLTQFIAQKAGIPWPITAIFLILWPIFIIWRIDPSFGIKFQWSPKQKLAFIAGIVSFLLYFMPLISADPIGQSVASAITLTILAKVFLKCNQN